MTHDELTPAQRDEVQLQFLRSYLGRRKRAAFAARPAARRYRMDGKLVEDGQAPRMTTIQEDRRR